MGTNESLNRQCVLKLENILYGMIDAHACHSSRDTWPPELIYVKQNGESTPLKEIVLPSNMQKMLTAAMGCDLVMNNTKMYNTNKGTANSLCRDCIPSLVVTSTLDMEFAHIDGYNGKAIPRNNKGIFSGWAKQIEDTEIAVALNPLRLFPLFSYDPRRYRRPDTVSPGDSGCAEWDKPFDRIVGCGEDGIWLGFCMNPSLGFRPFDEFCGNLKDFYKKCAGEGIPVLAGCTSSGITTHDAKRYRIFKQGERGVSPNSDAYCGKYKIVNDPDLDYFYRNYGHPRNWVPILKNYPDLRLCFAGSGGNNAWKYMSRCEWAVDSEIPGKDWIVCITKLTRYKNVYADISGLNIYDPFVRFALLGVLCLIRDEDEDFKHLKYKLIFGSDWYLTPSMDMSNMSYGVYCRDFKRIFDTVDESGKLWERVSLINPWNFYALGDKIDKVYNVLARNSSGKVNLDMLEKMKVVFNLKNAVKSPPRSWF